MRDTTADRFTPAAVSVATPVATSGTSPGTLSADTPAATSAAHPLKRRGLLIGAGAAGAAVLAVRVLPGMAPAAAPVVSAAKQALDTRGGYQVTEHVLRYYETTRS